jgi:hypothetical protein
MKPGRYSRRATQNSRRKTRGPVHHDVSSSFIDSLDWDGSILTVNIGANSYWYPSSSQQFSDFAEAASKGQFYNENVKLPRGSRAARTA